MLLEKKFKRFGVNKKREIARLLYEISKRDKTPYNKILDAAASKTGVCSYSAIKGHLIKLRFPYSTTLERSVRPYLPALDINKNNAVKINSLKLYPKNIYIEEAVLGSDLARRLRETFPAAHFKKIRKLKDFIKSSRAFGIKNYNKRSDNFFVIREGYDFFKKCPCSASAASCGYHIFNLGFGCVYECSYCYMQEYTNCPGIILPANIDDFFTYLERYKRPKMRLGTGEFTDSLALDDITGYSAKLIDYFNKNTDLTFEFKTKSDNIGGLLMAKHAGNIVVSWSLNTPRVIRENEFYTASLGERLTAASRCARAGYRVGFHFDPIIYSREWEAGYKGLINRLFDEIRSNSITWISMGTLRFRPHLKTVIENRFPRNKILDEELLIGFDNKLRYPEQLRLTIYKNMIDWIRKRSKKTHLYLCMEDAKIRKEVLDSPQSQ